MYVSEEKINTYGNATCFRPSLLIVTSGNLRNLTCLL